MNLSTLLTCVALLAGLVAGCQPAVKSPSPTPVASPPAKVVTENDLTTIALKPEAEQRLGIATVPVEKQKVARSRTLGGDLLLPLGRATGSNQTDQSIYALLPSMTSTELVRVAELQVDAVGQVAAATVQLDAAKVALSRAEQLLATKSGTQRAVDDARAQEQLAEAALQTARERRALLGAPLFNAVRADVLWVRVPVYAGDLDQIDRQAQARVSSLGLQTNASTLTAKPVPVPLSPGGASATVDLFYELDNKDGKLRSGQKVSVAVTMRGEQESLVAPASAVIYDIHGGTWVYENTGAQTYTRRRVALRYVTQGRAILERGPPPGTKVVSAGAAELFGAEFGMGK